MQQFTNAGGERRLIVIPPGLDRWPEAKRAAERLERVVEAFQETSAQVGRLISERDQATSEDRQQFAEALADGGQDPGSKALDAIEKRLAEEKRRLEALQLAVGDCLAELERVRAANETAWTQEQAKTEGEARVVLAAAVERVADCRQVVAQEAGLASWLRDPTSKSARLGTLAFRGLERRDGTAVAWEEVLLALRADAIPPPRPPIAPAPAHRRTPDQAAALHA